MTVNVWRIATEASTYRANDMSGNGAAFSGGRWNRMGTRVVYTSTHISLAAIETLRHLSIDPLPLDRFLVRIEIPDDVWASAQVLTPDAGWDASPPGKTSIDHGEAWVREGTSALLLVPSDVIHEEQNVLINPIHPDAGRIVATTVRRFEYPRRT